MSETPNLGSQQKTVDTIKTIIYAIILALFIRTFFFQVFLIPSGSMLPTYQIGDRVVVPKFVYGIQNPFYNAAMKRKLLFILPNPWYHNDTWLSKTKYIWKFKRVPQRFETIVFFPPEYPIGGPAYYFRGMKVNYPIYFQAPSLIGETYVKRVLGLPGDTLELKNGVVVINGKALDEKHTMNRDFSDFGPIEIPPDTYFCMGDNRGRSADSRVWGLLPGDRILGNVVSVMWPPKNFRWVTDTH